jgi:alpha-mannosidase
VAVDETVAVTNDTFTTVLRLMDEFPDFRFTQSQASVYEIARRYNPALFEKIKARVAEGRWEVVASQWVEGDKNLVSGESIARHLLYTRRFMQDELGLKPEDVRSTGRRTPSAARTIPTLVSRGGVTRYYMCRGGREEKPPVFWWRGPDGSRILVNLETTWYLKAVGPENASALLAFAAKTGLRDWMNVYGVGDHGGGPTRRDIRRILEMDAWPVFPRFRFATTREFYTILERHADRLPVLDRELNYEFTGCYTSQSQIKRHNRLGESQALDAEAAAVLALRAVGRPYRRAPLAEAWTNVLFGHFPTSCPAPACAPHASTSPASSSRARPPSGPSRRSRCARWRQRWTRASRRSAWGAWPARTGPSGPGWAAGPPSAPSPKRRTRWTAPGRSSSSTRRRGRATRS